MRLLRKILFPISLIYGCAVYFRNFLYDIGYFKSKSFDTFTICVGNLSVGGTGKTPMVEFLVSKLLANNKVAVLSGGYGRKSKGLLMATSESTVEELGDEPFQIYSKFPETIVVVDAERRNGMVFLEKNMRPDIVVLDDAFQHRKLLCSRYLLLTTYGNLFTDDWYLPTGNLRDSKKEAKRADLIVVTKCPENISKGEQANIRQKISPHEGQKVVFSYLEYETKLRGAKESIPLSTLQGQKVTLVTGIANPKPLLGFLKDSHIEFEHRRFRDHHFFTDKEIQSFTIAPIVLTTEKDFMRLGEKVGNLYFIPIAHRFLGDGETILSEMLNDFK